MAFQLTPLHIPSLTTDFSAQTNATARLGEMLGNLPGEMQKQRLAQQKQQILGQIGTGNLDYDKGGRALIALGDTQAGATLLGLGQKQQDRDLERTWMGGGGLGTPAAPVSLGSTAGVAPASLIQNESGGNWKAQNDAVGAGGAVGHFGRLQFGQARIQDAINAGALPAGTTPQAFMASPELQKRAEAWHFSDIDQKIQQNGFDKLIGQSINGVPITIDGLRAVAHLGGTEGMKKFVESGGRYNPADENGTRLSDYFARHGGGAGRQTQVAQAPQAAQPVQIAENEADVQRLEAAQAARSAPPAQVAQSPDLPRQGANAAPTQAQGFAIPSAENEYQQRSILSDKNVQHWQNRLNTAPTDRTRAIAQSNLNLAIKDAEQRFAEGKAPEAVREWQYARKNGLTDAKSPVAYAKEKADATRQDSAPTTRTVKQADGSEVIVQWNGETKTWDPLAAPKGGEAVRPTGTKLTESQSKDLIYHSRGLQALEAFEPNANAYASGVERLAVQAPGGNYVVSEEFQKARNAGRNFLASVLRKDTGAAVTKAEEDLYGDIFLPSPGDKPGTLAQKAEARKQAIDAIRSGLGTAEVLALGKRLTTRQPGEGAPAPAASPLNTPQQNQPTSTPNPTATGPNGQRLMWDGKAWVPFS